MGTTLDQQKAIEEALEEAARREKAIRHLKAKIKAGRLPRFLFARDRKNRLERKPRGPLGKMKLTWRMIDTVKYLIGDAK